MSTIVPCSSQDIDNYEIGSLRATYRGRGLTSSKDIEVRIFDAAPGTGCVFILPPSQLNTPPENDKRPIEQANKIFLPATADNVVNTLRNVVIGREKTRVCIVEHILCAVALSGINDLFIEVAGPELPLGNGSSDLWMDLFEKSGLSRELPSCDIPLSEPLSVERPGRSLLAIPAESFSVTYLMDWNHPRIGRVWRSWTPSQNVRDITDARTFGSLAEHKMLGLENDVVSLTEDGFSMPLRFEDEPVRHKILDLIGDLMLCGVNPLRLQAQFISMKGGHEMDVEMAALLRRTLI